MKTAAPTRRARRSAWVAALIAAALVMAGCGSSGPKPGSSPVDLGPPSTPPTSAAPDDTDSSGTSAPPASATPSYINAAPGETPPVRPPDEKTDAGVEAFIQYSLQVIDWAQASMDTTVSRFIALPSCKLCTLVDQSIDDDRTAGNRYIGGRYTVKEIALSPTTGDDTIRSANIWTDYTALTVYSPDGSVVAYEQPLTNSQMSLSIESRGGKWFIASLYVVVTK